MAGLNGIGSVTTLPNITPAATSSTTDATLEKSTSTTQVTTSAVTAQVSTTGGLISDALSVSDVRLDKVTALQTAISSGTYSVPSSEVASKIVDTLLR